MAPKNMTQIFDIQRVKRSVLDINLFNAAYRRQNFISYFDANQQSFAEEANRIILDVANLDCFAAEIAKTVLKYNRCSEKQAYWIARAAAENNVSSLYEDGEPSEFYMATEARDAKREAAAAAEDAELEKESKTQNNETMKTQISELINGSENVVRKVDAAKYQENPIGNYNCKMNVPKYGGTPIVDRAATAEKVAAENPKTMRVSANGLDLTLDRQVSTTGKTRGWHASLTPDQYSAIVGCEAPKWEHKNAKNSYELTITMDCEVVLIASSGKKSASRIIDESFISIQ